MDRNWIYTLQLESSNLATNTFHKSSNLAFLFKVQWKSMRIGLLGEILPPTYLSKIESDYNYPHNNGYLQGFYKWYDAMPKHKMVIRCTLNNPPLQGIQHVGNKTSFKRPSESLPILLNHLSNRIWIKCSNPQSDISFSLPFLPKESLSLYLMRVTKHLNKDNIGRFGKAASINIILHQKINTWLLNRKFPLEHLDD